MKLCEIKKEVKRKQQILDKYSPFPKAIREKIENLNKIEMTYANLFLDDEDVSKEEILTVLVENGYRMKKSKKSIRKIKNYGTLYDFLRKKSKAKLVKEREFKKAEILKIHKILFQGVDDNNAGKYRDVQIRLKEVDLDIPKAVNISGLIGGYVKWINKKEKGDDMIKKAIDANFKFVEILPFIDGNSGVARSILNLILMQNNYPPILVPFKSREKYHKTLSKAQKTNEFEGYYAFMYDLVNKSLERYLDYL